VYKKLNFLFQFLFDFDFHKDIMLPKFIYYYDQQLTYDLH